MLRRRSSPPTATGARLRDCRARARAARPSAAAPGRRARPAPPTQGPGSSRRGASGRSGLGPVPQLRGCVLADRGQQPVTGLGRVVYDLHERTVDQGREQVEHVGDVQQVARADALGRGQRERSAEHAEPAEQALLCGLEQPVAPFEHRLERAVAFGRRPAGLRRRRLSRSSRSASCWSDSTGTRAAASSIARGMPSSHGRSLDALGCTRCVRIERREAARARSMNSATAPSAGRSGPSAPSSGTSSPPTRHTCSPGTPSGWRLVAITRIDGERSSSATTSSRAVDHLLAVVQDQ